MSLSEKGERRVRENSPRNKEALETMRPKIAFGKFLGTIFTEKFFISRW
jgi:hypothetical protein